MKNEPTIRKYTPADKEAILNLFALNTPKYFSPDEEIDLLHYLENEIEEYFVLEMNQQIVAGGGINFSDDKTKGIISWDFVHPDFQGQSLGSKLLNYRIERLKQFDEVKQITVRTSQLVYKFYEKQGFKLIEIVEDFWAPGYDLYYMGYTN